MLSFDNKPCSFLMLKHCQNCLMSHTPLQYPSDGSFIQQCALSLLRLLSAYPVSTGVEQCCLAVKSQL